MAFPPDHPYMKVVPKDKRKLMSWSDAAYQNHPAERTERKRKVYETELKYKPTKSPQEQAKKERDWQNRKAAADAIAQHFGTDVFIPPTFRTTRDWRYGYFYDKIPIPGKMPDLKFKNEWWEMESYEEDFNAVNLTKMLRHGSKQSDNVLIKMNHNYNIDELKKEQKNIFKKSRQQLIK